MSGCPFQHLKCCTVSLITETLLKPTAAGARGVCHDSHSRPQIHASLCRSLKCVKLPSSDILSVCRASAFLSDGVDHQAHVRSPNAVRCCFQEAGFRTSGIDGSFSDILRFAKRARSVSCRKIPRNSGTSFFRRSTFEFTTPGATNSRLGPTSRHEKLLGSSPAV